jgi:hypothetical protein
MYLYGVLAIFCLYFSLAVLKKSSFIMTNDQIEKFITLNVDESGKPVKIFFKTRNTLEGIFIQTQDYTELKSKNFWRIVTITNLENYKKSKDNNLSRIFNGAEFTKLSAK